MTTTSSSSTTTTSSTSTSTSLEFVPVVHDLLSDHRRFHPRLLSLLRIAASDHQHHEPRESQGERELLLPHHLQRMCRHSLVSRNISTLLPQLEVTDAISMDKNHPFVARHIASHGTLQHVSSCIPLSDS